ncbi:MAG: hypothetical protein IPN82_07800 [Chitinophagaceae bacterium]|nr:hypothetical protein [Chitinophagaceae bacterium]MBK8606729.1 hypothetical protein [Chitinophagaceae bacterium]MBP6476576.1 hypothetical protein [Chitinophagaceae bacterium]MBP7108299.1 hypothetical protein [Chitinophagaceae bacterium]MBP7315581.1 hypothetical protein [Chitinophagaceae bacterium]
MKKYLFVVIAFASIAITGCRKIEVDGEKEIIIIGSGTTGQTITLQGRINADTILRKENTYILKGLVYLVGNHKMTIEAGTLIKGSFSGVDVATLIITRGSKIEAVGSPTEPIIFTSASPNPQSGDWGGIVICGKAPINTSYNGTQGLYQVEGGIDNANGDGLAGSGDALVSTAISNDNSGKLQYVRIEFAGYAFQPDKEINSLTLAAVGSGTTIDHIQVVYAKDDAYEFFGGTVNCKYLIAFKTQDDDFDTDNGYSGKVQFGLIIRDSLIADISKSEAFESDNNSGGGTVTPKTSAVFSNITAIGPRATLTNIGNSTYLAGAQIRRNSGISIYNSIIMGWPTGIFIDATTGTSTALNIEDSTLRLRNVTLAGNNINVRFAGTAGTTINSDAILTTWFTNSYFNNEILTNAADAKLIQPFNYSAPDPTPFAGSSGNQKILTGGSYDDLKFTGDTFFDKTATFRGAIAPAGINATWWKGWTKFNYN